ncbi:MAG: hypothetical protein MUF33_01945 [Candidatus Nanopelagicales bacterium]|jgi:hypothetical protein|nr:hypothetical protein [Candidatus Nanopelagicales bacterium]MCU0297263.1 hypothetical protein [Candidatus Nanopelagicales bacterium]
MSKEVATMSTEQLLEAMTGLLADRVIPVEGRIVVGIDVSDPRVEELLLEAERQTAAKIDHGAGSNYTVYAGFFDDMGKRLNALRDARVVRALADEALRTGKWAHARKTLSEYRSIR